MTFDISSYVRTYLLKSKPYRSAREEYADEGREMILLDANENPYSSEVNRYPDPMQSKLKEGIAAWKKVAVNQIYLSNGSDEFISQIIIGCCEPGKDHIIIIPPTFGMYKVSAHTYGVNVYEVPLIENFQLDVETILKKTQPESKLIFIPSPNNPTGNSFNLEDIEAVIKGFSGLVVVDEAYVEFSSIPSVISWLSKYPNLIICQTFSKAQGMAGARLGMAFAHQEIIRFLNRLKSPYNINSLSINAALKRIEEQDDVNDQVAILLSERNKIEQALSKISFVSKYFSSDANFLLVKFDDSYLRYKQLLKYGVVVRNSSNNTGCENTLRISVGLPEENDKLISTLRAME
jgi:histidinol-phosphate aminotransferase